MTTTETTTETTEIERPSAMQGFTTTIYPDRYAEYGTRGKYARRTDKTNWTEGTLSIVADVLDGWPCLIEVDRHTGHTVVGTIVSVGGDSRQPAGWNCVIEYQYPDGSHRTAHAGINVGTIVPLPAPGRGRAPSHFDVGDAMRKARRAALDAFNAHVKAENDGAGWYGKREAHAASGGAWMVYYTSQENDRYDVTKTTSPDRYVYGPKEASCAVSLSGQVSKMYRREFTPGEVVRDA